MLDPVSSSIRGEGKLVYCIPVTFVIQLEEDNEASTCKEGMGRFGENVIE